MNTLDDRLTTEQRQAMQREAIWTWRWLGWRNSTPAFKASVAILGFASVALAVLPFVMR